MSSSSYTISKNDSTNYEDGYKIFLQRSDFRERILDQFSKLSSGIVKYKNSLRVLDVGCGNGHMTKKYIQTLKTSGSAIHITLLEPAQQSLNEAVLRLKPEVESLQVLSNLPKDSRFDLIIASYVFYHLSADFLDQLAEHLDEHGSLMIMMGTNDHPLKNHPALKLESKHGSSDKLNPLLDKLKQSEKYRISRHKVVTNLSLEGLKQEQTYTDDAQKFLSFSLNKNFNELSTSAMEALDEIFNFAMNHAGGTINPIHEIIWIERAL